MYVVLIDPADSQYLSLLFSFLPVCERLSLKWELLRQMRESGKIDDNDENTQVYIINFFPFLPIKSIAEKMHPFRPDFKVNFLDICYCP